MAKVHRLRSAVLRKRHYREVTARPRRPHQPALRQQHLLPSSLLVPSVRAHDPGTAAFTIGRGAQRRIAPHAVEPFRSSWTPVEDESDQHLEACTSLLAARSRPLPCSCTILLKHPLCHLRK